MVHDGAHWRIALCLGVEPDATIDVSLDVGGALYIELTYHPLFDATVGGECLDRSESHDVCECVPHVTAIAEHGYVHAVYESAVLFTPLDGLRQEVIDDFCQGVICAASHQ